MNVRSFAATVMVEPVVLYTLFMMQDYLTDVWKLSFTHAAAILNIWGGISKMLGVFFLFLADTLLGNLAMVTISIVAYNMGMVLITMSTPPILANATDSCKEYKVECTGETQRAMLYIGMALLAVGIGGYHASLKPFLQVQDTEDPELVSVKILKGFLLVGFFGLSMIPGSHLNSSSKDYWLLLFLYCGITVFLSTIIYFCNWCDYNKTKPYGSPLTDVGRVFVAAALKISQPLPDDTNQLYMKRDEGDNSHPYHPSRFLRCLEKAAIILPNQSVEVQLRNKRWKLCSVEEVEAAKFVVRVIPIGATFVMCTIVSSVGNTYLVEQGSHMNHNLGKWKVPTQILLALFYLAKACLFDKFADRLIQCSKKYGPPIGIAMAMVFSILCCVSASGIEIERLKIIKRLGLLDKPDEDTPMPAFWLFFPFFLLAGLDSFFRKSAVAFFESESPDEAMTRYCSCFTEAVSGLGLIYSVLSVYVVGKMSEIGGRQSWFQDTLNKSRLDFYYWALATLAALNLLIFIPLTSLYKYKNQETDEQSVVGDT